MSKKIKTVEVTIPYAPRPLQAALHSKLKRFNVLVCHRRFGKTVFCINEIIAKAMQNTNKRPQYAYIAPELKQAKNIAWDYLKEYVAPIPGTKINNSELTAELPNGAKIFLLGAENTESIRGFYFDGVVLDEVAQMPKAIWDEVVRPALSDRLGWAIFIGTPKGRNYFHTLYEGAQRRDSWYAECYKASETGIIPYVELCSLREEMTQESYDQEYECSFTAAIKGAYYGKILGDLRLLKKIGTVDHDLLGS